jgi:hypothetical protein
MIERLEQQKRLTSNQWKLICTANVADLLDFFDLSNRLRNRCAHQGVVADLFAGRRDPHGIRPRCPARRLAVRLAR